MTPRTIGGGFSLRRESSMIGTGCAATVLLKLLVA